MAYRFKLDEGIEAGVRRIAAGEIERATSCLAAADGDRVTAIHEARKSMKRIRALLRLVRPALGEAAFHRQNAYFRDTSALLAHTRDTQVLLETVTKLDARFENAPHASLKRLYAEIAAAHAAPEVAAEQAARDEAMRRLEAGRARVARLKLSDDGFAAIGEGLSASYRKARRAFARAYEKPDDEAIHDWRKGVQQHWRHMALLSRAWPELTDARHNAARRLSQILGDDHDLHVLRLRLETWTGAGLGARERRTVVRLAQRRQAELRALARPYGERLFADSPRHLAGRFAVYWTSAKALRDLRAASQVETGAPEKPSAAPTAQEPGRRVAGRRRIG